MSAPWTFSEAVEHLRKSSTLQKGAETAMREAFSDYAKAEQAYRRALSEALVRFRAEGQPATMCADLARGDEQVSALRCKRDIAEGMKEAAIQEGWRRSADRKDAQRFAAWSQARELAEHGQPDERLAWTGPKAVA